MLNRYPVVPFEDGDSVHLFNVVWAAPVFFGWKKVLEVVEFPSTKVNISL